MMGHSKRVIVVAMFRLRKIYTLLVLEPWLGICVAFSRKELVIDKGGPLVSLTSFGDRISRVHLAIESIFRQSESPALVVLWLASSDMKLITRQLRMQQKRGLKIFECPEDIGSHKKYFYAMQRFPNMPIVTADDDLVYRRHWLRKLTSAYKKKPDAIHCHRAMRINISSSGELYKYKTWGGVLSSWSGGSALLFPTTGGGVLYPPHSVDEKAFDLSAIRRLCPRADDVWLKVMAHLKGTKIMLVPSPHKRLFVISKTQGKSLSNSNLVSGNDVQLASVCREYQVDFCDSGADKVKN